MDPYQRHLDSEHPRHWAISGVGLRAREDNKVSLKAGGLRGNHLFWGPFSREEALKCLDIFSDTI